MTKILHINGAEGGGQLLRSALTLSMLTGQAVSLENIRGARPKPGLMRQHLTCVKAAQQICQAQVKGDELKSTSLFFEPGTVRAGKYRFDVGSAGSTTLVMQTILLPLLLSTSTASCIEFIGGTHNPMAPSYHFIENAYLPVLRALGFKIDSELHRLGFMPAGGGCWSLSLQGAAETLPNSANIQQQLCWAETNNIRQINLLAISHGLAQHICRREISTFEELSQFPVQSRILTEKEGVMAGCDGNYFKASVELENAGVLRNLVVDQLGRLRLSAEKVARNTLEKVALLQTQSVDQYLADQLLMLMAVFNHGQYFINKLSNHIITNRALINQFAEYHTGLSAINIDEVKNQQWCVSVAIPVANEF